MFDLLLHCPLLVRHIADGKVGFGINHEMYDFQTKRKKNLDLVICTIGTESGNAGRDFVRMSRELKVNLLPEEHELLLKMPKLLTVPVGTVYAAIEAKACMTEHGKALPRLHDELNSSHLAIHGSADFAIAAGFVVVNIASTFISTDRNKFNLAERSAVITKHHQPDVARKTIDKIEQIPRRTQGGKEGFDALGIVVLDIANDGSTVRVVTGPPAPKSQEPFHYDQMVRRIASLYESKFSST